MSKIKENYHVTYIDDYGKQVTKDFCNEEVATSYACCISLRQGSVYLKDDIKNTSVNFIKGKAYKGK